MRYIVTTGRNYTDIDGYASCIAYADLLRKEGKDAIAILPGVLNESIIPKIRAIPTAYSSNYTPQTDDIFAILDISQKEIFPEFVDINKVALLYDHHLAYEDYWCKELGPRALIEKVGSCATIVVEEAIEKQLLDKLDDTSKMLLYTAIFAESLNLQASVTTGRDIHALDLLRVYTDLPESWQEEYFKTMQEKILKDPIMALQANLRTLEIKGRPWAIGELELWEGKKYMPQLEPSVRSFLTNLPVERALVSVPSIMDKRTYILTKNNSTKQKLAKFGLTKSGKSLPKLRLRREWFKLLLEADF